jgi:hypothetical protein
VREEVEEDEEGEGEGERDQHRHDGHEHLLQVRHLFRGRQRERKV